MYTMTVTSKEAIKLVSYLYYVFAHLKQIHIKTISIFMNNSFFVDCMTR